MTHEALERVKDELLAMHEDALVPMNVDPVASAMMVLGVVPELQQHRAALTELCGEERAKRIDRLPLLGGMLGDRQVMKRRLREGSEFFHFLRERKREQREAARTATAQA